MRIPGLPATPEEYYAMCCMQRMMNPLNPLFADPDFALCLGIVLFK